VKPVVQLRARNTKPASRLRDVPVGVPHHSLYRLSLQDVELGAVHGIRAGRGQKRQIVDPNPSPLADNRRSFQHVAKLAYITGPCMREQDVGRVGRQFDGTLEARLCQLLEKGLGDQDDVVSALSERRDPDFEHVDLQFRFRCEPLKNNVIDEP
jgi:hypothetical protein